MSNYAWMITRDHFAEGMESETEKARYSCVGVVGPHDASASDKAALKAGKGKAFRLYDDDGELMATGRIITHDDPNPLNSDWVMAPLDDYGVGNWGCTEIRYMIDRRWVGI